MTISWSDDLLDTSDGLDIIGVRKFDQRIEFKLVNGITTVSQRARYFSILTWALGSYLSRHTGQKIQRKDLEIFLHRVEFMTLAASRLENERDDVDDSGALGKIRNRKKIDALLDNEAIVLPNNASGAMFGTYFAPCRAIGLLKKKTKDTPTLLTPRGTKIFELKNDRLGNSNVVNAIYRGGKISKALVETAVSEFSLGSLANSKDESQLLHEALVNTWDAGVTSAYSSFNETIQWVTEMLTLEPSDTDYLILRNYKRCTQQNKKTSTEWAEYEYRRRSHFALELIISAFTKSLCAVEKATVSQIVQHWIDHLKPTTLLMKIWPEVENVGTDDASKALSSIPNQFLEDLVPIDDFRDLPDANQAYAAIVLLKTTTFQTRKIRNAGHFEKLSNSPGEQAILTIETASHEPFAKLVERLVDLAVLSHIETTYRKMGAGQKCSLRFALEGHFFRSTGGSVQPGHSNARLSNVLHILSDIGHLKLKGEKYTPVERDTE